MFDIKISTLPFTTISLLGLSLMLVGACSEKKQAPPGTVPDERIPVITTEVKMTSATLPITASGILGAASEQRLSFKIGGVINKIYVDEGDWVKTGQVLASLDKTEIDAQRSQAQQALLKTERDLVRVQSLYRDSSATLELLENATTARDVAKENLGIASFNQQYASIVASRPGRVIKKLMNAGEITGPGTPILVLFEAGADDWIVKINVSDRDWARMRKGMTANIKMDSYPEKNFKGQVSDVAPAADPASGLYTIEIKIRPDGARFAPGLFATVELNPADATQYAVLPIESILEGNGKSGWVFVVNPDGETVRKVPVQSAVIRGKEVYLQGGLEDKQLVVRTGTAYLTERSKIIKR
ncbi:MAG: efflux RND transporter periplasmic adaptor subunit [Lewinellaceae bacterium]|nr:efflux RND transporter periplasmic adaptor subunit [Lewinellaceae bacterium]